MTSALKMLSQLRSNPMTDQKSESNYVFVSGQVPLEIPSVVQKSNTWTVENEIQNHSSLWLTVDVNNRKIFLKRLVCNNVELFR